MKTPRIILYLLHFSTQFEQNFLDKHFWDLDNQILYDGCLKDKWITKFFSYSACQSFLWRGERGGGGQCTGGRK